MKSVILILLFTTITSRFCAAQYMQVVNGNGVYSGVRTNDIQLLSQAEVAMGKNNDVNGNPFWNEDWKMALLFTGEHAILVPNVKLNLYSQDVWYKVKDSIMMIAKKGQVKGITFFNGNDTTSVLANFVYLSNGEGNKFSYYQFLNSGKAQLVKLSTVSINKSLFDPFSGKAEQNYTLQTANYLYYNSTLTPLKGSNKETISAVLQQGNSLKEWMDKNKNRLKSESDILLFLDYFNKQNNQ